MRLGKPDNYDNKEMLDDKGNLHIKLNKVEKCSMVIPLLTDKDKERFIKNVELIVRGSNLYKDYIQYLKEYRDMSRCEFFNNICIGKNKRAKVRIEIHHEPFTLYDLVNIVMNKYQKLEMDFDIYDIADEVMSLHYKNMVGLIPLSRTVHKLVGLGRLFIPLYVVDGRFFDFYKEYEPYIPEEIKALLKEKFKLSRDIKFGEMINDVSILNKKLIYIDDDKTKPCFIEDNPDEHI